MSDAMANYRLRDDERKQQPLSIEEPHQFPSDESDGTSPTTSIYGFAVGFAAGLLSALNIINFAMPLGIGNTSLLLSILLISMFIANVLALRKARSSE